MSMKSALLDQLFGSRPETLMALFGAATSLLLFYLVGAVLRYLFGWQTRQAGWEAHQDQATTALVEALVAALVTEAGHLRTTLDSILEEALRRAAATAAVRPGHIGRNAAKR
jgi:hypothetical protein